RLCAIDGDREPGVWSLAGFGALRHRHQLEAIVALVVGRLLRYQCEDVFIEALGLAIGELLQALEGLVDPLLAVEREAELLQALLERIAPGELAKNDLVGRPAHVFGAHDLVGVALLQHTVLVDARRMGKGVGPDYGLVGLHREAGDARYELGGRYDLARVDPDLEIEVVAACL